MDKELLDLLNQARSSGANEQQLQGIVDAYNSKKKSTSETTGNPSANGTKSTSQSSLNSQSQSSGNEFAFNPYGVNDVTTQSGIKIPIDKSKIPAPYDKDAYVNNVQKDINAGKLSPIDHNIIATSSTKNPQAVSAYLQGDNKTGEAVDRVDYINKNKQDLTGIIQDYNSQTGEKIIPDALLADPDKLSSWAENYQKQLNSTIKDNTVSGMVYAPGGNQDWLVEADKKRNETRAILNNFLENKKPLLDNHIIQSVAETDLPRNEKIKRIAQLTNPSTYANTQKVLDNTGSVSIDNPLQMVGSLIDEIKGSKKQDDEMLNSQVGYADLALNDAYKKIANDKAAVAHLSGDAGLMQDAKNTYAQIDESVIKKYPAVLKSQMADEIAKQIATESGQLNGSDDEPISRLGVAAKYNGITSDMVKTFVQRNGWDKDPDRKDAADWLIEHPENIKDASIFGGIIPAAVKPFADLGLGLLDVSGVRTKRDVLVSKEGDQLFPTEFNPDETKANFTFLGTDIHARSTVNSIAGLTGMTAIAIGTGGIGRAVGFGLDAAETVELASEGIDVARKAELLGKVGSASEHAAGYASFAIPSIDQNLKASYDNPNITNDAERAAFVTLGAVLNGEGGRLLNLGSIGQVPGLEEDFVKLAKGLSEKTITEDATKELLNKGQDKFVDYVVKYGKKGAEMGGNILKGAATMAYFTATDKILKMAFKDPNAKAEDLIPDAGHAFVDGLFAMIPMGFVQAVGSPEKNPNSSIKGQLFNMASFPDATEDIFKLGKKSDEDFNYKKQVLNTAVLHKNVLDATEAESGNKFTTAQKSAYVGNKTVESFLREKADRIIATDNRSQAKKAELIGQANELSQQSADALDGLQYTKTLEPLYDLYHAEKDYDKAFSNFQADKSKENQKAVEETRNVYDNLQNKYFNDKYGVVGAISNTKEPKPETFTIDNNPATKSQVEDILNGGQKEADKFDIEYTGNDNAIHKQIQEVGGTTENNVTTSPKSRETVLNEGVNDLYSRLEDKAPAHYLDPLDKQKSIEGLTNQVLENPNDIKNDVGKKLAVELISRNSTEDINKSIDKWQTISDKTGENVDEQEKKEANRHIELLNAGLEEKGKIHEAAKPEPIQQPSTVSSEDKIADIEKRRQAEFDKTVHGISLDDYERYKRDGGKGSINDLQKRFRLTNSEAHDVANYFDENNRDTITEKYDAEIAALPKSENKPIQSEETKTKIPDTEKKGSPTDEKPNSNIGEAAQTENSGNDGTEKPPVDNPGAGDAPDEWSAIRKEKLKEVEAVKNVFEKETGRKWTEIQQQALENVQKEFPNKSLYDAVKTKTYEIADKYDKNQDYNPTANDLAVIQEFKRQTEKRINQLKPDINSDNDIVRTAALIEGDNYEKDLVTAGKAFHTREAGTAFGFRQSESRMDENYGLQIRRMQLMRDKGGEPLTKEEDTWVNEKWEQEKEIMKQEQAAKEAGMKEDFDNRIASLQKEYEAKIKKAENNSSSNKTSKEKTLSQKGKDVADRLRKLKKPKGVTNIDFTLGTWDLAVEGIAKLVEVGSTVAEAIEKLIKDSVIGFKEDKDRSDFENHIAESLGTKTKEDYLDEIKAFAKENDISDVTKELIDKNLIRDYVNSHIGEVDQKDILDVAAKDLKDVLPDITKPRLIEAYLKENEFKADTKKDLEGGLAEAKKQLNSIAKATEDIEDLNNLKKLRQRNFPTERAKSEAEQELLKEKADKIKEIKDRNNKIKDDNAKLETERNRQLKKVEELKAKKADLENGVKRVVATRQRQLDTPEIEKLKSEVIEIDRKIKEAEAEQKAADKKVISDRDKKIKHDNKKIETESIRQVKRVLDLNDKKEKLENGIREKRSTQPKIDTPEIERLKKEVTDADKNLREAESLAAKMDKDIQDKKDKIDELNAGIKRAIEGYDQIKTHRNKSESEIDTEIEQKQKELKKAIKDNSTDEQQQKKALENAKENAIKKAAEYKQRLADKDFEDKPPVTLRKQDAELIRLKKQQSIIEEQFRKKQKELRESKSSWGSKVANFIRASYVTYLISKFGTLGKVATMSLLRPISEGARKLILGKAFNAVFPNISAAAERGGEGASNTVLSKAFQAYFRQFGDKKMESMYENANKEYEAAKGQYEAYKATDNPDAKKLLSLKNKMNDKLIQVQGSFIYKFIGGSSLKDALQALVNRANEIEKQFGHVEGEHFKDGNWLDKTSYVLGFIGRSHSALKTFSGRFSFAAGFMARLEGAVKAGEDITQPDKVLEIAHESYLDWERGKYQQSNFFSNLSAYLGRKIGEFDKGGPWEKLAKAAQFVFKFDLPITRVPVNILHEAVVEYSFGLIKALYITQKEIGIGAYKLKNEIKNDGIMPNEAEFKAELSKRVSQMDEKQAATIVRCFTKGGIGVGIYALALMSGAIHFGIFPHMGQKKKKDEADLAPDELNPGQVQVGQTKFGELLSGIIEHTPSLFPMFMGLGMAQAYKDQIDKGKSTSEAVQKSIYTHLKILQHGIPQLKLIEGLDDDIMYGVKKRLTDAGIIQKKE